MQIVNSMRDGASVFFKVEVNENQFVDVKYPDMVNTNFKEGFAYVMDCENGCQVYSFGPDEGIAELSYLEQAFVVDFVRHNAEDFLDGERRYIVSVAVDGRIDVEVRADSFEEAKEKAEMLDGKYDWNALEIVSRLTAVNAEDRNGVLVDY